MLDSLVRVSRRVVYNHYASILAEARSSVLVGHIAPRAIILPMEATFPRPLSNHQNRCWPEYNWVHWWKHQMINCTQVWLQTLPFQQFHVLFNSLSKVLFIFRSLYLCAIGLWPIFSFRWNLPPILSCIPKQLDSSKELHTGLGTQSHTGFSPSMTSCSKELRLGHAWSILYKLQFGPEGQISNLSCCRFTRRY